MDLGLFSSGHFVVGEAAQPQTWPPVPHPHGLRARLWEAVSLPCGGGAESPPPGSPPGWVMDRSSLQLPPQLRTLPLSRDMLARGPGCADRERTDFLK